MEATSIAHDGHAAHPPEAHRSSRVETQLLGMLLFIISEIMIFAAFFTAYFFIRVVVTNAKWPGAGFHIPVDIGAVNTGILLSSSLTIHWALTSIKNGNRFGLKAGMVSTFCLGATFLSIQINEYIHLGIAPGVVQGALQPRAAPWRRGAGHLLALRRHHVDLRLLVALHPVGRDAEPATFGGRGLPAAAVRRRGRGHDRRDRGPRPGDLLTAGA
jgi:hypothetical protein